MIVCDVGRGDRQLAGWPACWRRWPTDNRPRMPIPLTQSSSKPAVARDQEQITMQPNDPNVKWVEEPKLGLTGKMYLPLFSGLTTTTQHLFGPEGHGQLSRSPADDRQSADLSRRASAQQGRAGPREVRGLLPVRHGLPGALHRHRRHRKPLARSRKVSRELRRSTSCAASSAACAKRLARSTRSS